MRISLLNLCYLVGIFTHVFEAEAFVASFPGFKPVLEGVRSRFTRTESSTRRSISLVPSHLTGPDDSAASNGELLLYDDLVQLRSEIRARENSTLYQKCVRFPVPEPVQYVTLVDLTCACVVAHKPQTIGTRASYP